jgi:hypothetical protein
MPIIASLARSLLRAAGRTVGRRRFEKSRYLRNLAPHVIYLTSVGTL